VTGVELRDLGEGVRGSLATLKDVAGITGSFVCTQSGHLLAREIPAMFDDTVLSEAGSRLLRVGETFAATGDDLDVAVVRYGEHRLYLKTISGGLLCIVVAGPVNMPALRMAANLVGRRIAISVARAQAELPAVPSPPAAAAPVADAAPPPRPTASAGSQSYPGMRRFRGRSVE
jgi:predicted regulator of Ras-like GTPase activity (Roadblock/LC7/MglB family)